MSAEYPKVYNQWNRKARKEHKCCECKGTIKRGEEYIYASGIWDKPADYKFCLCCMDLRMEIMENIDPEDTPPFGGLHDDVFQSDNIEWMQRYVDNAKVRGGSLGRDNWMGKRLEEAKIDFAKENAKEHAATLEEDKKNESLQRIADIHAENVLTLCNGTR